MTDGDVISHLLAQEEKTSGLVREAQGESARTLAAARAAAEAAYTAQYEGAARALEMEYDEKKAAVAQDCKKKAADYRNRLESQQKHFYTFNGYLETLLFPKERP
jgi:vacuolar-type H+-ATPase subunit H